MRGRRWGWFAAGMLAMSLAPIDWASAQQVAGDGSRLEASALAAAIDAQIDAQLAQRGIPASPQADDAEFLRRLYLDLHGVVPPKDELNAFLQSPDPDKRAQAIDRLLESPDFGRHLADLWDGYLLTAAQNNRISPDLFTAWLADAFQRKSWDQIVGELLTAAGQMQDNPAVTYMLKGRDPANPAELANLTGRYFLGVQLTCAQCHDHPFTSYKQDDFWGIAGFFSQVEMPGQGRIRSFGIADNPQGSFHLANFEDRALLREPRVLGPAQPAVEKTRPYRAAYAEWVASADNPYFARAMANRMWWHLFGRGIVNPVDDMHPDNPASHPELLELLSRQFAASGFDLKYLVRAIAFSQTYQRTSRPVSGNETDQQGFSHMAVKVLTPEQLYDSLSALFGEPLRPLSGATGRGRTDPRADFVESFAREVDASPTSYEAGIPQLLRMMNSGQFLDRSRFGGPAGFRPGSAVREPILPRLNALPAGGVTDANVEALYLHVLSRHPREEELALCREHRQNGGELREVLWALVNSSEFCLNH